AEDVLGFVRAADKINVALDDLGEGATLTLSKLTGIFGDEQRYGTEQALLKVGSVINELSQNCSASAPYLAEFAQRMGGVGAQAKMTIPQIMGFAAVLDSNAQAMEASSTALQQVIVRMMQEPAKYAKVAGLDVKQFSDMLKRDVNGALIMFLDTLNKAGGMDVLSPMFKDMGENGSRAIAALSTLANNIDAVKQQQRAAAEAFREGTSVTKEFEVQNNTVQASLEKAQKSLNDLRVELGERLAPLARHFLTSASAITRALMVAIRFVDDNKAALISLAAGIAGYTIAANAAKVATAAWTLVGKIHTAMLVAQNTAYLAFTALIQLLTGHVGRAAVAWRSLNLAIKSNPIGLAVAAITTAIAAIWQWVEKTKAAREEERRLAEQRRQQVQEYRKEYGDISQASAEYAKTELDRLRSLYSATQDHTKSTKERIAAVKQLQKTYPQAFSNLTQEAILAGKASKEYRTLASNIILAARAEAAKKKIAENQGKLLDLQLEEEDINDAITSDSKKLDRARTLYERSAKAASVKNQNRLFTDGRWVKELQRQKDNIADLNANLDGNIDRLEKVRMQQDEIYSANERLAKLAASATMDIATNEPADTT
ncbi:MAG: phage tail tape measure protein, partial [Muribaculaceae bacterium]|nr:phage tail tape measure protein [Muribaculaceae bacterium]